MVIPAELTPEIGCILAPFADIQVNGGNTNGCLFGRNITTSAEGHMWAYKSTTTVPEEEETEETESEIESETESETETEI